MLLPLDAHAHIDPAHRLDDVASAGAVLAMTLSLEEAALAVDRREPYIVWGVGCHPRLRKAQEAFSVEQFANLVERTAIVGEIGLDKGSRVPLALQLQTFRQALAVLACPPLQISYWPSLVALIFRLLMDIVIHWRRRKP